ncbi:MAG: IS1 family transposase [Spirochaetaceae bacterium]|nr:IS1 family transposase [Spirochaetaceae bacterium]
MSKKCCLPVPFRYNSFTDNTLARIFTKNFTLFTRYPRITDSEVVTIKKNTQKIERKHLSLRTWCSRLVRKGIRFSKDPGMHKIVIALVINFWFFQRILW